MPQSLAQILIHYVFSTKGRERWLTDEIRDELHAYIGGIVSQLHGVLLNAGSVEDHVHLLVAHPRTVSPAELVEAVKKGTSKWIKTKGAGFRGFHWQNGYGAFSISLTHRTRIDEYFAKQREHHRGVTFQEEYRLLLKKNGLAFDEAYVWD